MVIVYMHACVFVSRDCLSIGIFFLLMGNLGSVIAVDRVTVLVDGDRICACSCLRVK